jgi:hypothetical protein
MKKLTHLVYIPWTGLGIQEYKGDAWFKYRIGLFKRFVLPSLVNQTTKDFILWCSFRAEEKNNPLTAELEQAVKESGLKYIFTFDGIMMWDDRGVWHNKDLKERMERSLAELKNQLEPSEWIYKTDLGSDDMFSEEALEEIQKVEPKEKRSTVYFNGYVLDMENIRLAEWNRPTSCSKYTIIYPYETFFNAEKHLEYIKDLKSHEYASEVFDAVRLPDRRYMAGVHRGNISSGWENKFRGRQLNDIEKKEVLKKFGIYEK